MALLVITAEHSTALWTKAVSSEAWRSKLMFSCNSSCLSNHVSFFPYLISVCKVVNAIQLNWAISTFYSFMQSIYILSFRLWSINMLIHLWSELCLCWHFECLCSSRVSGFLGWSKLKKKLSSIDEVKSEIRFCLFPRPFFSFTVKVLRSSSDTLS